MKYTRRSASFETSRGFLLVDERIEYVECLTSFNIVLGTVTNGMVKLLESNMWFHVDSESSSQVIEDSIDEEI